MVHALSLHSSHAGLAAAAPSTGPSTALGGRPADGEMRHREALHLWALVLLGIVRTSVGLWSQRLDLNCSKRQLRHWSWMRHWAPESSPSFCSNRPCHSCSHPPMCGSLKCFSCNSVEEPYFRQ